MRKALKRAMCVASLSVAALLAGCDKGVSGKYGSEDGLVSVDFKSGNKAAVKVAEGTLDCDYTVSGDTVTVVVDKATGHNLVFKRTADDTLTGEAGVLKKK